MSMSTYPFFLVYLIHFILLAVNVRQKLKQFAIIVCRNKNGLQNHIFGLNDIYTDTACAKLSRLFFAKNTQYDTVSSATNQKHDVNLVYQCHVNCYPYITAHVKHELQDGGCNRLYQSASLIILSSQPSFCVHSFVVEVQHSSKPLI